MELSQEEIDERLMEIALEQAHRAREAEEVPIGAVIVKDRVLIAKAHNQVETLKDPTAHAEIIAITQAANAVGDWRLEDCTLYVTKEPCPMCAGAIVNSRIARVVWGADDPKRGGAASRFSILESADLNHRPEFTHGVSEELCSALLKDFFKARR